jgi:hypothetical protein
MRTLILLIAAILLLNNETLSQPIFEKVTTGPLVNTPNQSNFAAWGDYNNDDYPDLVVSAFNDNCHSCSYPLQLYKNNGDGSFARITDNSIAQTSVIGSGLSWADYDNDGKLDLFVCGTISSRNKLFHNEGNGNFTEILTGDIVTEINSSQSCAWADYDNDGYIDLFVTNRYGMSNRLYKNNGDGTFTKILSGSIVTDNAESRCSAWGDYDNDGWQDLFVVNYQGYNDFLYRNNQNGTFTRVMNVPMVYDQQWGSACQWSDYDNNGFIDLFVTNTDGSNLLYYNQGEGNFIIKNTIISENISYGLNWGDFDNDGYTDIFVCNPYRFNSLFKYNGGSSFTKVTNDIIAQEGGYSIGCASADFNNDGKLDMFVTNRNSTNFNYLYKNVTPNDNYMKIKLSGCKSNRSGIGARIKIVYNGSAAYRDVTGGSLWSQSNIITHFGMGSALNIDSLIVDWPSDTITILTDVPVNQLLTIYECGTEVIGINNSNGNVRDFHLYQNYPNPFNPSTVIRYSLKENNFTSLKVYDVLGNEVASLVGEIQNSGTYSVEFNGSDLPSGVYFYKIESGNFALTQKMTLLK